MQITGHSDTLVTHRGDSASSRLHRPMPVSAPDEPSFRHDTDHEPDRLAQDMANPLLTARQFGELGERYVSLWLEAKGWHILSRNWRTRYGELDIVAITPERMVVFVEVKSRHNAYYGTPQEAVTRSKQVNLRRAAAAWLIDRRNRIPHAGVRFDVITILMDMGQPKVGHIVNAF
ncbi:endonuclease [Bifidobacterium reuteri DSM 23975]|uniref:UPF0102 protein BREU_0222 n=2 Tax=Bifidobacterium reuteri TaxID=983706 RepID=A0A087CV98_9BIFI|nr:endonuclease [Bifidobacterium reuteri DSM 23975]